MERHRLVSIMDGNQQWFVIFNSVSSVLVCTIVIGKMMNEGALS